MEGLIKCLEELPVNIPYVFYMWNEGDIWTFKPYPRKREPFLSRFVYFLSVKEMYDERQWLSSLRILVKDVRAYWHIENDSALPDPPLSNEQIEPLMDYLAEQFSDNPWLLLCETRTKQYFVAENHQTRERSAFIVFLWLLLNNLDKHDVRGRYFLVDELEGDMLYDFDNEVRVALIKWIHGDNEPLMSLFNPPKSDNEMEMSDVESEGMNGAVAEALGDDKGKGEA